MLTLEELRQIDPKLKELSDKELIKVRAALYKLGQIIFDDWLSENYGSKYPIGVLRNFEDENKI
jgi:hypothetical protein